MPKYNTGRCIPVCEGVHSETKEYLNLSVVLESSTGNSYTSKKKVPVGIELNNLDYWALSGQYNAQMAEVHRRIAQIEAENTNLRSEIAKIKADIVTLTMDVKNSLGVL